MNIRVLIAVFLGITITQAKAFYPYYPTTFANHAEDSSFPGYPFEVVTTPAYQQAQQQNQPYYPEHVPGYYPYYAPQYSLLYYLPESRQARLQAKEHLEFHDINNRLDKKSELAIKRNNLNHEALLAMQEDLENESNLSGMELSALTTSSLISSARKKQFLEKVVTILLNNPWTFYQDRKKLEKLFNHLQQGNKISATDENWLQKLVKEYRIPKRLLHDQQADEHFEAVSQLNEPSPSASFSHHRW